VTLEQARALVGHWVEYTKIPAHPAYEGRTIPGEVVHHPAEPAVIERGLITSVNDAYVFVRYVGRQYSAATRPEDLEQVP
jgi:hypothetical protein